MIRGSLALGLALGPLIASIPSPARAQEWTLDAYVGRVVFEPVTASVGTSNGVLGLRYSGADGAWFYVSAATPFAAGDPLWGATGLGRRFGSGGRRFSAGVDVGAHGHGYRDPSPSAFGGGATLEALPFVAVRQGAARLEVRSGLVHYGSAFSGETRSRTIHDTAARLALRAGAPLRLTGEVRHVRASEGDYTHVAGSASVDHGRGALWASVGRWSSNALPDLSWRAGVSLRAGQRYDVWASAAQVASDPLYWNASRRSWSLGVSRRLGNPGRAPAPAPVPPEASGGRVTFRIPLSEAAAPPFIAGDFTGWEPVAMVRSGEFWTVSLVVEPGYYRYAFRTAEGRWFVPESVPGRRDDGYGGFVAVLTVP